MDLHLRFDGVRCGRAKVEGDGTKKRRGDQPPIFTITSPAAGRRRWWVSTAEGWWADLAVLDLRQPDEVRQFVRRRGMLGAVQMDGPARETTERWPTIQKNLQIIREAWEPTADGSLGIVDFKKWLAAESLSRGDPEVDRLLGELRVVQGSIGQPFTVEDIEEGRPIPSPVEAPGPTFVPMATSLATFMLASARIGLRQRVPMRRCTWCESHFFRLRTDAKFCSPSCRVREHERAKLVAAA